MNAIKINEIRGVTHKSRLAILNNGLNKMNSPYLCTKKFLNDHHEQDGATLQ